MLRFRSAIANKVSTAISAVSHASRRAKLVFGSAFALAFLVAPAAALMLSGALNNSLSSADAGSPDPGTANNADTNAESQSQASVNDNESTNGSGHSTSVDVNNGTTTVKVDGQTVVGPTTGPVSKTINTNDHHTTINVDRNGTTTTTTLNSNNVNGTSNVNISTNSYNSTETSP